MDILGVKISEFNEDDSLVGVKAALNSENKSLVFTPNPEMLVRAYDDDFFKKTLNLADINLCDGFGLKLVAFLRGKNIPRITGVDFTQRICALCRDDYKSVYLLGTGSREVVEKTVAVLRDKYPGLKIAGCHPGIEIIDEVNSDIKFDIEKNNQLLEIINEARPDVIFVAFGMGKQEKWLAQNLPKLSKTKVGMGVGGAFDFISGYVPRAPLLMRRVGLEWTYRFFKQPERLKRIFNATIRFLFLALTEK